MNPMPPEGAAAVTGQGAPAPAQTPQPGQISQLVKGIHGALEKLASTVSPEDQPRFADFLGQYEALIQESLGGAEPPPTGNVPSEAGHARVKPVL